MLGFPCPSILAVQNILAGVESGAIDDPALFAWKYLLIASKLTNIKTVVENVRQGRAVEPPLTLTELVSFLLKLIRKGTERVSAR